MGCFFLGLGLLHVARGRHRIRPAVGTAGLVALLALSGWYVVASAGPAVVPWAAVAKRQYVDPQAATTALMHGVIADAIVSGYPCPNHVQPRHCCGDLRTGSLEQAILSSEAMQGMRARYQVQRYTACRTCAFRYWCAGDCRGEVLATTGDPAAPSPHCEELQRLFPRMLWLIADGDQRLGTQPRLPDGKLPTDAFRA